MWIDGEGKGVSDEQHGIIQTDKYDGTSPQRLTRSSLKPQQDYNPHGRRRRNSSTRRWTYVQDRGIKYHGSTERETFGTSMTRSWHVNDPLSLQQLWQNN